MSSSIYSILPFNGSTNYVIHDVCSYTGEWNSFSLSTGYLYCVSPGLGGSSPSSTAWDGYVININEVKPKFIWIPSYGNPVSQNPKILAMKFGDGYESRMSDGINNDLLNLELSFENRNIHETVAILHFLTQRNGKESFVFTPQPPYTATKRFVCKQWKENQNFFGNYSISATFEEVVN